MKTKTFNGKKVKIKELSEYSLKDTEKFLNFINSFLKEGAQLLAKKEISLKEEKEWLSSQLKEVKNNKKVYLVAEYQNQIIGTTEVGVGSGRSDHVGTLHIAVRNDCRRIGLGKYLMKTIIKSAKKRLRIKIINIPVFITNKPAIGLYKYCGFKKVATIPKQIQYKGKLVDEIIMVKYL